MTRLFLFFAWALLAAMPMLFIFKIDLHSDILFLDNVMSDMFQHAGRWGDWKLTPAPAYAPDMLAYAIGYFIFPDPVARIVFVCFVQAMLLAGGCIWLASIIRPSLSREARLLIVLIVAAVVLVAVRSGMWLFFNSTNNHFAALLFSLLCIGWIFRYLSKDGPPQSLAIVLGAALGTASTSIFVLAFTLPALIFLAACYMVVRSDRELRWTVAKIMALIACGHLLAMGLDRFHFSHDALAGRVPVTILGAAGSAKVFIAATQSTFARDNSYTFALSVFVLGSIVWIAFQWMLRFRFLHGNSPKEFQGLALDISGENWRYNLCVLFLMFSLPLNIFGAIASGGFADQWGYRYFIGPLAFGVLLWVLMLDQKTALSPRRMLAVALALFFGLVVLGLKSVKPLFQEAGRTSVGELISKGRPNPGDALGTCLGRVAAEGFPLQSGIADFWNARGTRYKITPQPHILPVLNSGAPFFHMLTLGPLLDPSRYGVGLYNFAILRQPGTTTQFELKADTIGKLLPAPTKVIACENTDSEIWLYSSPSLDGFVRSRIKQFLFQINGDGEYVVNADQLPGAVGKVDGITRVARENIDATGFLSYGPYIDLPAGRYQMIVNYASTDKDNQWDIGRFNDPNQPTVLASGKFPASAAGELKISFEVKDSVSSLEVRSRFAGRGSLTLTRIRIKQEKTNAAR